MTESLLSALGAADARELGGLCQEVAEVETGGAIGTWVNRTDVCSYIRINDTVEVTFLLMQSDLHGAANNGCPQYVTVNELVATVADVADKKIYVKHTESPVSVQIRSFCNTRIYSTTWEVGSSQYLLRLTPDG